MKNFNEGEENEEEEQVQKKTYERFKDFFK